jgi:hypothetical protein
MLAVFRRRLAAFGGVSLALLPVTAVSFAGPAAATSSGDSACNYSSSNPNEFIAVSCQKGSVVFSTQVDFHTPSASSTVQVDPGPPYYIVRGWSGSPCGAQWAAGGVQWEGGPWAFYWGYRDNAGHTNWGSYGVGPWNPGTFAAVDIAVPSNNPTAYSVYDYDPSTNQWIDVANPSGGAGMCIVTAGLDVNPDSPMSATVVNNATMEPLIWNDSGNGYHEGFNDYYNSRPCGVNGQTSPNCLNGAFYTYNGHANDRWDSNQP